MTLALALLPGLAHAQIAASSAWVQVPAAGATSTSAFLVIENPTMYDVYVVGVASPAAGGAEMVRGDDAMPVKELAVPSFGQVELKPGDVHVVLKDLKRALAAGDEVELILTSDGGESVKVSAAVRQE